MGQEVPRDEVFRMSFVGQVQRGEGCGYISPGGRGVYGFDFVGTVAAGCSHMSGT